MDTDLVQIGRCHHVYHIDCHQYSMRACPVCRLPCDERDPLDELRSRIRRHRDEIRSTIRENQDEFQFWPRGTDGERIYIPRSEATFRLPGPFDPIMVLTRPSVHQLDDFGNVENGIAAAASA